jgi:hypothetical protein
MDARIMRSLAELIAEHHRQNRQDYKTDQYSDFDTTVSHDLDEDYNYQAEGLGTTQGLSTGIDP